MVYHLCIRTYDQGSDLIPLMVRYPKKNNTCENMENRYKSYRIIDGKAKWVIVDDNGKIINRNPNKEELVKEINSRRHKTKICCKNKEHESRSGMREYWFRCSCKKDNCTRYLCYKCYQKYNPDSWHNKRKLIAGNRTGNLDHNCSTGKGNNGQELAVVLYGWKDLNKKNNTYNSPIDCFDPKTGLFHQIKTVFYNAINGCWKTSHLEKEWEKEYKSMVIFCISENGLNVLRIYKMPIEEVKIRTGISLTKNPTDSCGNNITPWYEQYRVTDDEELKKANDIWQKIIKVK